MFLQSISQSLPERANSSAIRDSRACISRHLILLSWSIVHFWATTIAIPVGVAQRLDAYPVHSPGGCHWAGADHPQPTPLTLVIVEDVTIRHSRDRRRFVWEQRRALQTKTATARSEGTEERRKGTKYQGAKMVEQ